ncbi:hypothetical protein ACWGH2_29285 [Streptomyces sp. NPDC054871]
MQNPTAPTTDHLLDTPLPQLLAEFRVDLSELPVDEPKFTGGTYVRPDGTMLFAMPAGQNPWERQMIARAMLGQALRVPMPELPAPYQLTELDPKLLAGV